jgi:hypothetical protein
VKGYWNKPDGKDIEMDIVAINETDKIIRLGSCKRSSNKHTSTTLSLFDGHIARFKKTELGRKYNDWKIEKALYSPIFEEAQKQTLSNNGYICVDMLDFERWLQ